MYYTNIWNRGILVTLARSVLWLFIKVRYASCNSVSWAVSYATPSL